MPEPRRRPGRPSKLDTPVAERDGKPVTAADALVERLRTGAYREEAARSIGISKQTLYNWLYAAALARQQDLAGQRLTAEQRRLLTFLDAVEEAEASAMLTDWTRHAGLAAGGIPQVTTTVVEKVVREVDPKDSSRIVERVVERTSTTRTTHTLPSREALEWRMERRWPKHFGRRQQIEVGGIDGAPIETRVEDTTARARALADEVTAYMQGVADGTVAPVEPPHTNGNGRKGRGRG